MIIAAFTATDGWLVVVFFGACSPLLIWDARRLWRGPHPVWDGRPELWDPFGPAYWHGLGRNVPLIAAVFPLGCVPVGLSAILPSTVGAIVGVIGAVVFFFVVLLMACVFFFNWPHWCVPPHRREEPGALVEFRDNQRRRRAARRAARD